MISRVEAEVPDHAETLDLLRKRIDQGNIDRWDFLSTLNELAGKDVFHKVVVQLCESIRSILERSILMQVRGFNIHTLNYMARDALSMKLSDNFQDMVKKRVNELVNLYAIMEQYNVQFKDYHKCPITQEVMLDPVFAMDGYTYERLAIEAHFRTSKMSPATNQEMTSKTLVPNVVLATDIKTYPEWMIQKAKESEARGEKRGYSLRMQQEYVRKKKEQLAVQDSVVSVEGAVTRKRKVTVVG